MTRETRGIAFGFALAAVLASLAGCNATPPLTTMSTNRGDREIQVAIDGKANFSYPPNAEDTAVIVFDGRSLFIEKDRVVLDGEERARLPADATKVRVEYRGGNLTVVADGVAIEVVDEYR